MSGPGNYTRMYYCTIQIIFDGIFSLLYDNYMYIFSMNASGGQRYALLTLQKRCCFQFVMKFNK